MTYRLNTGITLEWADEAVAEHAYEELRQAVEVGDLGYFDVLDENEEVDTDATFREIVQYVERYGIELEVTAKGDVYLAFDGSEDLYPLGDSFARNGALC